MSKNNLTEVERTNIQKLQNIPGLGPTIANKLLKNGVTRNYLLAMPINEIVTQLGISVTLAKKFQFYISNEINDGYFQTAKQKLEQYKNNNVCTFGVEALDELFFIPEYRKGGIRSGETYEFYGAFRTGKSQICHQLCITSQLPTNLGGYGKKVVYIDTEGTFSPSRIVQIAENIRKKTAWDKNVDEILNDILVARALTTDMQNDIVQELIIQLGKNPHEIGLLIVDSISSNFRSEYSENSKIIIRQQRLNHHLSFLQRIAEVYNIPVIVTNQVLANPHNFFGDPVTAIGGNVMAHWAKTRCYLRMSKNGQRIAKIIDSPIFDETETIFQISNTGLE